MEQEKILLSDLIESLREELVLAQEKAKNSQMKFVVELVTLELSVEVTKMNAGNAGVKFWVINAGLDVKDENKYAQKFTLSLKPSIETASTQDESTSLKVVEEIMGTPLGG